MSKMPEWVKDIETFLSSDMPRQICQECEGKELMGLKLLSALKVAMKALEKTERGCLLWHDGLFEAKGESEVCYFHKDHHTAHEALEKIKEGKFDE